MFVDHMSDDERHSILNVDLMHPLHGVVSTNRVMRTPASKSRISRLNTAIVFIITRVAQLPGNVTT
jgi:hypothetical protein